MTDRLAQLRDLISRADAAYFNSAHAFMDDAAYDRLKDELAALNPDDPLLKRVGAEVSRGSMLGKVSHSIPMGSQRKAMNRSEFMDWAAGVPAGKLFASLKMDGGSVSLEFRDGAFVAAATRGDGFVGEDISANAISFRGFPKRGVRIGGVLFTGFVRAEVVLLTADWTKADPDRTTNPRNLGNGISRRKDGTQSELLSTFAFRAYGAAGRELAATQEEMFALLDDAGFTTSPRKTGSPDEIWEWVQEIDGQRSSLPFWIDGIVASIDHIPTQVGLGLSDNRPRGEVAIKFAPKGAVTTLEDVEITVGHTGAIIPTAKLRPVQISGTSVSAALLCNWEEIRALGIAIGDEVEVIKAGDIIPKIVRVVTQGADRREINEPTVCPACGGPLGRKTTIAGEETASLYCLNDDCEAKATGKLRRWIGSLNILGIGDELLLALVNELGVRDAAGLYSLRERRDELARLALGAGVRLGEKRADKVLEAIDGARELSLEQFVGSLGIEALGKRRVELIRQAVPGQMDSIADWMNGKLPSIAQAAGVPNIATRIATDLEKRRGLIDRLLTAGVTIKVGAPKARPAAGALKICITGTLSQPRSFFAEMIAQRGHVFVDSVGKDLNYLVMADPTKSSSKAEKAKKWGVKCIGEADLMQLLGA